MKNNRAAYDALMKVYPFTLDDLPNEGWLPAPYCADYLVSTYGRVKSLKGKVKILKPVLGRGYLRVDLSKDGKPKHFNVHQLVALAFIPNPNCKREVNHIDGNKLNNYVDNLEWCTQSENIQHAVATGLKAQGEEHGRAKLTNEQVEEIRANPYGLTLEKLAEKFGVGQTAIGYIQRGKTFKNAGGPIRKAQKRSPNVTEEIRAQILADWATGNYSQRQLAREHGVSQACIWNIIHGR